MNGYNLLSWFYLVRIILLNQLLFFLSCHIILWHPLKEFGWLFSGWILCVILDHHVVLFRAAGVHSKHFFILNFLHSLDIIDNTNQSAYSEQYAEDEHVWTDNFILSLTEEFLFWCNKLVWFLIKLSLFNNNFASLTTFIWLLLE